MHMVMKNMMMLAMHLLYQQNQKKYGRLHIVALYFIQCIKYYFIFFKKYNSFKKYDRFYRHKQKCMDNDDNRFLFPFLFNCLLILTLCDILLLLLSYSEKEYDKYEFILLPQTQAIKSIVSEIIFTD